VSRGTDESFLVLFYKNEQNFFFEKRSKKLFSVKWLLDAAASFPHQGGLALCHRTAISAGRRAQSSSRNPMTSSTRLRAFRLLAATALCCAGASAAHAQRGGTLYGFGDSLTDDGNLPKYLGFDYPAPPYYKNHFSNGPVWIEYLPGLTGLAFSPADDYAAGGAFANTGSLAGAAIPGVQTQIADAAAAGLRFTPADVVSVWAAANNYFSIIGGLPAGTVLSNATVQSDIQTVAQAVTDDVATVIGLGARRVLVFNVPDLGITPNYLGTADQALASGITDEHNEILAGEIKALQRRTGVNIYYINANAALQEVLADPGRFGISNTTQECIKTPTCVNNPNTATTGYLFWDDVHPTTGVHEYLAYLVGNQLDADRNIAGEGQLILAQTEDFLNGIDQRLAARRAATPEVGTVQYWLQGHYSQGSLSSTGDSNGYHDNAGSIIGGADFAANPSLILGGAVGWGQPHATFGGSSGSLSYNAWQGAVYADWHQGGYFADATADYANFNTASANRAGVPFSGDVTLRPNGNAYGLATGAGYLFATGPLRYGPVGGLTFVHGNIGDYSENGEPLIIQHVASQNLQSLVGKAGLSVTCNAGDQPWWPRPTLSVSAAHEFLDGSRTVDSYFLSADLPIHTKLEGYGGTYGLFAAGLTESLGNGFSATGDFETNFSDAAGNAKSFLLKVTGTF
jgi:outer membrane lipase/esterase